MGIGKKKPKLNDSVKMKLYYDILLEEFENAIEI